MLVVPQLRHQIGFGIEVAAYAVVSIEITSIIRIAKHTIFFLISFLAETHINHFFIIQHKPVMHNHSK